MNQRIWGIVAGSVVLCAFGAFGQVVAFNSPAAWVTQRNDSITVRAQIDTAQITKKSFAISVNLVDNNGKKKPIGKKTFPVTDYSGEFAMGTIGQTLVGGRSYLAIDWSIPGTSHKGFISPIGIVALDKLPAAPAVPVAHAKDGADAAAVAAQVGDADLKSVGTAKYALLWNKSALYIVLVKPQQASSGTVRFAFDGKNGKNAFLSFADRVVLCQTDKDTLWGSHYTRLLEGDILQYQEKPWNSEIGKTAVNGKTVIRIPWYDIGIIPQADRKFGIGIMEFDGAGKQTAAAGAAADFYIPGTWGDFVLVQ